MKVSRCRLGHPGWYQNPSTAGWLHIIDRRWPFLESNRPKTLAVEWMKSVVYRDKLVSGILGGVFTVVGDLVI